MNSARAGAGARRAPIKIGGVASILVVEDEPIVRDVVVRYLSQAGYRAPEASDGSEAKKLVAAEPPSLVILDVIGSGPGSCKLPSSGSPQQNLLSPSAVPIPPIGWLR